MFGALLKNPTTIKSMIGNMIPDACTVKAVDLSSDSDYVSVLIDYGSDLEVNLCIDKPKSFGSTDEANAWLETLLTEWIIIEGHAIASFNFKPGKSSIQKGFGPATFKFGEYDDDGFATLIAERVPLLMANLMIHIITNTASNS
jgi:hypothetical protein